MNNHIVVISIRNAGNDVTDLVQYCCSLPVLQHALLNSQSMLEVAMATDVESEQHY